MKKNICLLVLLLGLVSCKPADESLDSSEKVISERSTKIHTVSTMKKVMMGEDLSSHLRWDSIPHENLFAVCPLGRIEGEITVIDGKMFASRVAENDSVHITNDWNLESPFAVYAHVKEWLALDMEVSFSNDEALQTVVEAAAKKVGKNIQEPFVFRIQGFFESVDYHIISKPKSEVEHNHELHEKAKKHFSLSNVSGELMGFYSQHHEGVFTHRGHFIHTHFLDDLQTHTGHLEKAIVNTKVKIFLSK